MSPDFASLPAHPQGEQASTFASAAQGLPFPSLPVDTIGRRFHVEWDPLAPVTPMGQLVFFAQFLGTSGLYSQWVKTCPLKYESPNAPKVGDVLGASLLAVLNEASRYAHVTALRGDQVNPKGLGMEKLVSEDSLRRAFQDEAAETVAQWQTEALLASHAPALERPWIADLDVTIKPVFGHQEGAELGCNPHKPGRPSHACHTVFLRTLRVALDVEVRSGKEHSAMHGLGNLWRLWNRLAPSQRPWLVCGDSGFGNERMMSQCEEREQGCLFRQRGAKGVRQLIRMLSNARADGSRCARVGKGAKGGCNWPDGRASGGRRSSAGCWKNRPKPATSPSWSKADCKCKPGRFMNTWFWWPT